MMPKYLKISITLAALLLVVMVAVSQRSQQDVRNAVGEQTLTADSTNSALQEKQFLGSQACQTCHIDEYQQWQESDHFRAMQEANKDTVLADFSDVKLSFHGIESQMYQQNEKFLIDTDDADGNRATFEIKNTFGFYPLQQYLVETKDGHIQALNIAWDSRSADVGGQRWFHLQPEEAITPKHPFYWANHFQNWNSRCADCHSTNVQRRYDASGHSFDTTFSEINVACEACHGAGSRHVDLAQNGKLADDTGFVNKEVAKLQWVFPEGKDIAVPTGRKSSNELDICGACHALRGQLAGPQADGNFHDLNRLQLLNETTYFADGQSKEEAFVVGSFLQSKMYHKGVTCSNCHNSHTGRVLVEGNGLCAQCHKPEVFDTEQHHRHEAGSTGAQCISCHMPERAFMQVDERRDHSFTIPRPKLSLDLGVPNACTQCHVGKNDTWANQQTAEWGLGSSDDHWAYLLRRASQNDILVTRPAVEAILDTGLPDLVRASLLQHLAPMPSRVSAEAAQASLNDPSPLLRRAAVVALQRHSPELRWQLLSEYLDDPSLSVRMQVAETLADTFNQTPPQHQAGVAKLINEYRGALAISDDSVATQLNIANLELRLGNLGEAERAYKKALVIEPSFVPALLNVADLYRRTQREDEERIMLEKAIKVAPDSGAAQHAMGLFHVRNQDYAVALTFLKIAVEQADASPYYAYVHAVALENQGQLPAAIESLKIADKRWPNQYELLMTLILYLEKSGNSESVLPYLSKLSAIAPGSPAVKQLINKSQARNQ